MSTMIPYKNYDIAVKKEVFSFWQVEIRKNRKVLWFSRPDTDPEFITWDMACQYAIGLIDNGEV